MHDATLDEWVAAWRVRMSRVVPLTAEELARVKDAIRDTYVLARLNPPAGVIRARSPRQVMAMAVEHQRNHSMRRLNDPARITEAIRASDRRLLRQVPFDGSIASRVDSGGLNPRAWGTELHPDMLRSPGAGNAQSGVAAEASWILDDDEVSISGPMMRGLHAMVGRSLGGPTRFLDDLVFVSDMPTRFLTDAEGRPHCAGGPALTWSDGTGISFWHGTRVPDDFFGWSPERALSAMSVEVRRCAFERLGVDVLEQFLTLLAEEPDPANPPHVLRLYDLPRPWLSGRLLVVDNASIDKGGHRRRFQIFVPPDITDPVEAAANSFGMTADQYKQMQRAT